MVSVFRPIPWRAPAGFNDEDDFPYLPRKLGPCHWSKLPLGHLVPKEMLKKDPDTSRYPANRWTQISMKKCYLTIHNLEIMFFSIVFSEIRTSPGGDVFRFDVGELSGGLFD